MSEHTPGPWKYNKTDDDNFGISAGWTDIALVYNREDDPGDEANARLIAAAPELYEALGDCFAFLKGYDRRGQTEGELIAKVRTALGKVQGS